MRKVRKPAPLFRNDYSSSVNNTENNKEIRIVVRDQKYTKPIFDKNKTCGKCDVCNGKCPI